MFSDKSMIVILAISGIVILCHEGIEAYRATHVAPPATCTEVKK